MDNSRIRNHITFGLIAILLCIIPICRPALASGKIDTKLVDRTLIAIHRHYIDPDRIDPKKMLKESLDSLQIMMPEVIVAESGADSITLTVGLAKKRIPTKPMGDLSDLSSVLEQVLDFISVHYRGEVKPEDIESTVINGMLDALDPHSGFLSKKIYDEFKVGTRGKFGGLGIVISIRDGMLTVIAPIEGTPASQAGIKAGDHITQIGDESTINMPLTDAVNKLRGKPGTKVSIVIEREGRPSRKVTLARAIINIDSVKYGTIQEGEKRIGYVKVKNFQANTFRDAKAAIKSFHKDGGPPDGLILDLRNNPGGLLNIAVDLADLFIKKGTIVSTVGRDDEVLDLDVAHSNDTEPDYPLIVLINEGSASASEIVAGALMVHNRAVVMGGESFGKGSVQTIFEPGGDTALKLTIARYKPAGTESIQLVGIIPDIELNPIVVERDAMNLVKDEPFTEKDLEEHLERRKDGDKEKVKSPIYTVNYLAPKEGDEEEEEKARAIREYSKELDVGDDFAVNLAKKLLAEAGRGKRDEMLKLARDPILKADSSQQREIDKALKKLDVDWSEIPAGGMPNLKLSHRIIKNNKAVNEVVAGDKIRLELTATNVGQGTFSKLLAIGKSKEMAFLANQEFPFGLIRPGESKKWSVPMEIPESLASQTVEMEVVFKEAGGNEPKPTKLGIPVKALPEPLFAFDYTIPKSHMGRDFKLSKSIPMDVSIENKGPGTSSEDTIMTLSGDCDDKIFIEKGRTKIGEIAPNASKKARFQFHMLPGYDESNCGIDLTIADVKRRMFLTKRIDVHPSKGSLSPPPGTRLEPPTITLNEPPPKSTRGTSHISGTIRDSDPILDYFIFVGDKKISYHTNPEKSKTIKFETDIPLEPGNNTVIVGSRDEHEMTSKKIFVIERSDSR